MSSSVVNDFLSALFDNNATPEADITSQTPSSKEVPLSSTIPSYNVSKDANQVKEDGTGIKRRHEEEEKDKVNVDQPDTKRIATESANTPLKKENQHVRKSNAPKPQYQPFQQQLLGSSVLSDPYDAYIASQATTSNQANYSIQKVSQKHIASPTSISRESSSTKDKDDRSPHAQYAAKSVIDKLPAESRMIIKKLPPAVTHDEIVNHFSKYGKILEVVPKLGFGFVQFDSVAACRTAIENENGKPFQSVELVLEACRNRPHSNRQDAEQSNQRSRQQDSRKSTLSPRNTQTPGHRHPNPPNHQVKDRHNANRAQWNNRQQNHSNNISNQSMNPGHDPNPRSRTSDQTRQFNHNRNQRGGPDATRRPGVTSQSHRYNDPARGMKSSQWPMQKRYGQAVPVVELVVWDTVADSFIKFIEGRFRARRLQIHTLYLHHNDVKKDTLMQHFIMEGVTAVMMVDNQDEAQGKVYMQVFGRANGGDTSNVRFDEYAGISVDDAVGLVARANDESKNSMMLTQSFSQPTRPQAQRQPAPIINNLQQPTGYGLPLAQPAASQPVAPALDVNAVAALLGIVQNAAQPNAASDPGVNNAAIQLLTSLVASTTAGTNLNTNTNNPTTVPQHTISQQAPIPQQYDPAYSQLNYSPQSTTAYNTNGQSPHVPSAYTTAAQPANGTYTGPPANSWYPNNNQNANYYTSYNNSQAQGQAPSVAQAGNTSANVGEILAKLHLLQQQGQQK